MVQSGRCTRRFRANEIRAEKEADVAEKARPSRASLEPNFFENGAVVQSRQEQGLVDADDPEINRVLQRLHFITGGGEGGVQFLRAEVGGSLVALVVVPIRGRRPSVTEQIKACLVGFSKDPDFRNANYGKPTILARCEENGVQLGAFAVPNVEFTRSERAVAELVGQSLGNEGIARLLRKRPKTVANQLTSVFRKANVQTRAELSKFAFLALSQCEI